MRAIMLRLWLVVTIVIVAAAGVAAALKTADRVFTEMSPRTWEANAVPVGDGFQPLMLDEAVAIERARATNKAEEKAEAARVERSKREWDSMDAEQRREVIDLLRQGVQPRLATGGVFLLEPVRKLLRQASVRLLDAQSSCPVSIVGAVDESRRNIPHEVFSTCAKRSRGSSTNAESASSTSSGLVSTSTRDTLPRTPLAMSTSVEHDHYHAEQPRVAASTADELGRGILECDVHAPRITHRRIASRVTLTTMNSANNATMSAAIA